METSSCYSPCFSPLPHGHPPPPCCQVPAWSGFPSWPGKQNHTKLFLSRLDLPSLEERGGRGSVESSLQISL